MLAFLGLAAVGLLMVFGGLAWDVAMHATDPHLAEREGVFTVTNPSHAVFAAGLILAAAGLVGAVVTVVGAGPAESRLRRRGVRAGIAGAAALVLFGVGGLGAWAQSAVTSHAHDASAASDLDEDAPETMPDVHPPAGHGEKENVSEATAAQRAAARKLLDDTIAATIAYRDPSAAEADGFVFSLNGPKRVYHVPNASHRRDGRTLDPARPESLLYVRDPSDDSLVLVGVVYRMEEPGTPGPAIGGPITVWHDHGGCMDPASRTRTAEAPDGACPEGTIERPGVDMMHVWFTDDLETAFARRVPIRSLIEYQRSVGRDEATRAGRLRSLF